MSLFDRELRRATRNTSQQTDNAHITLKSITAQYYAMRSQDRAGRKAASKGRDNLMTRGTVIV